MERAISTLKIENAAGVIDEDDEIEIDFDSMHNFMDEDLFHEDL